MSIPVHRMAAPERRMLLEMLASERSGEDALRIGTMFGRDITADRLVAEGLARSVGIDDLVFTELGRHLAEALASRLVHRQMAALLAS